MRTTNHINYINELSDNPQEAIRKQKKPVEAKIQANGLFIIPLYLFGSFMNKIIHQ